MDCTAALQVQQFYMHMGSILGGKLEKMGQATPSMSS